jgi:hypothetical protein
MITSLLTFSFRGLNQYQNRFLNKKKKKDSFIRIQRCIDQSLIYLIEKVIFEFLLSNFAFILSAFLSNMLKEI